MQNREAIQTKIPTGLDVIFSPKTVAVVGASERVGSVGRTILWNLISSPFGGTVYPVNPTRASILGVRAYPSLKDVPDKIDLVVIVLPAKTVPGVIRECVQLGITGAIIISAGFKEVGAEGVALEQEILAEARRGGMRLIGPNCLGVMRPVTGMNATFADGIANPGAVAFISQSGALLTAVLDWSRSQNVGFSAFISVGTMLDVGWGDLIDYLGQDESTESIVIYMESVGDARSALSAAREVALKKPIIVIKAGRTEAAAHAAASHTGSLTGSDDVLDAAFRRSGILRVDRISDVFYMAEVLAKQPRPKGNRLTIITNAGGPGVLATDSLIGYGGDLAEISDATIEELNKILPAAWSHANPVDVLGDATPQLYAKTLEIVGKDENTDGTLVILTPQAMTDPTKTAEELTRYAQYEDKPVLASWMGGPGIAEGERILNSSNIPTFNFPDTAARVFNYMWQYTNNLRSIYETPMLPLDSDYETPDREKVAAILQHARESGRTILTEYESKEVLAAYYIPTVKTLLAETPDAAAAAADSIGYPVVLKLNSETITHKSDVGGVQLNLRDEVAVRNAFSLIRTNVTEKASAEHFQGVTVQPMAKLDGYELILGSSMDPQFGPVLLFGSGGTMVEVFKDSTLGLPPLNTTLARRMIEETKIVKALRGVRGRPPIDMHALEQVLVRFSQLVVEQPWIAEMDINPLLVSHENMIALDARVVTQPLDMTEAKLPRPAIRPYPMQYVEPWTLRDGTKVTIRPIRPEDEPLMVEFHQSLSERTVFLRYLEAMDLSVRTAHDRLSRLCFIDYDREMALVVIRRDEGTKGEPKMIGIVRLTKMRNANPGEKSRAELGMLVSDKYQRQGIGHELLERLIKIAKDEKVGVIFATLHEDNPEMSYLTERFGFVAVPSGREHIVQVELDLSNI
ncbi:MAG: bifunctional acetate--CoA ligase family protein/GNAT family N-acetyltransferase [Chloroflexi bacterium]|nr:bifunctional acetate--CoA ligase family protein/GNAT family N-acetyltransferase [Chloroflexota bacterium]